MLDADGDTVSIVHAGLNGKGIFDILPQSDSLRFVLNGTDGVCHEFHFPKVADDGCVLRMNPLGDRYIRVRLRFSQGVQGRKIGITIMNGGTTFWVDTLRAEPVTELVLERSQMKPGVNQMTVFNSAGQVLAERLFFVCPDLNKGSRSIQVLPRTPRPDICGKVTLDLQSAPDASLSFSAMDAETLTNGKSGTIYTYMLLGSEVGGYIHHPERYFEADDSAHRMAADTLMLVNGWRRYVWQVMSDVTPWPWRIQQIEDQLYLYGTLRPATGRWIKKNPVDSVDMSVFLYNRFGQSMSGKTVTDSLGHYAFSLPDVSGNWSLQIETRREGKLKTYNVGINRHFTPALRYIFRDEAQLTPPHTANLFKMTASERAQGPQLLPGYDDFVRRIGENAYLMQTVKVRKKKNYWTDNNDLRFDETEARAHASFYYNCAEASDECLDMNRVQPEFREWLASENSLFSEDATYSFLETESAGQEQAQGPRYDGRPIIWVLNNSFKGVTGLARHQYHIISSLKSDTLAVMPTYIDEICPIYITDNAPEVAEAYIRSDLATFNPVIIHVYTHPDYSTEKKKGKRRTFFSGFNYQHRFEMYDYSVLPPMEDFRRTLYWNPDVKTDASGRATVRFYNNSSCREMYVSVEGMTAGGLLLSNE